MIVFTKPSITALEEQYISKSLLTNQLAGDGPYTAMSSQLLTEIMHLPNVLLTNSGTASLEMSALLLNIGYNDEIIVPSYTFTSTVNALMLRGAKPIFCDIRSDTMNIDENKIEMLITNQTKAIFVVHYAGVPCEMDTINSIAKKYNLRVIEDAAQAVGSSYKGISAGTLGDIGCYSFHNTKNYSMGEGGAITCADIEHFHAAEIIREKGTNRQQMIRGQIDKYTWQSIGSSYVPADLLAALLQAQLERFDEIMQKRMVIWNQYHHAFESLEGNQCLVRPTIPENVEHNAHMYYILLPSKNVRDDLIQYLANNNIQACFHYIPLHSSPMGLRMGYTADMLSVTEKLSGCLLRLPLYTDMSTQDLNYVIKCVFQYFDGFNTNESH